MRFLQDNLIESLANLSALNINADYPVDNLKTTALAEVFRSGSVVVNVTAMFSAAQAVNIVFVANHNLLSGASITLQASDTSAFTVVQFSQVLDASLETIVAAFNTQTWQYWRLVIDATGQTVDGQAYVKIGGWGLGSYYQVPGGSPSYTTAYESTGLKKTTRGGQKIGSQNYIFRRVTFRFPKITRVADRNSLVAFFKARDWFRSFFVQFEESCIDEPALYGDLLNPSIALQSIGDPIFFQSRLTIEEAK